MRNFSVRSKRFRYFCFGICTCFGVLFLRGYLNFQNHQANPSNPVESSETTTSPDIEEPKSSMDLLETIKTRNEEQIIRNLDVFGPITNDTIIIVIQAHKRKIYLQALLDSLKSSKYINETLLVLSHNLYDDDINKLVESVRFTRVLQIFFPYSLQTHPDTFPGFSPGDCPHGVPQSELPKDCFGKPRDIKSLQVKHHWWWKINFVFNHLRITRDFQGLVLFLEEDHYVLPDVLHILKLMKEVSARECKDCNIFGVGQNPAARGPQHYRGFADKVSVQQWNNMGFAFTREFWRGLDRPRCRKMFCEYNDYNWDFTLAYLSHKCLPQQLKPLTVFSPRVFHVGDCGTHFHGVGCDRTKSLNETRALQPLIKKYLFPPKLTVVNTDFRQYPVDGHNGGWDDPRDVQLCKNIANDNGNTYTALQV